MLRALLLEPSSHGTLSRDSTHSINALIVEKGDRNCWALAFGAFLAFCALKSLYTPYILLQRFTQKETIQ